MALLRGDGPARSEYPLGVLRYIATASPGYCTRWFADGFSELAAARAPCLTFDRKERLQAEWLRKALGTELQPPLHWLPSSQAFVDVALAGIGWGMIPAPLVMAHFRAGRLAALKDDQPLDVPLFWQQSRIVGPVLGHVTRAVVQKARAMLISA